MTQIGLRRRVYRDRELDQLARDTDANLRGLWDALPALELKPSGETRTGFTWGGKPIWMVNLQGTVPTASSSALVRGVERVLAVIGHVKDVTLGVFWTPPISGDSSVVILADGANLYLNSASTVFDGGEYDLTIFFTRVS